MKESRAHKIRGKTQQNKFPPNSVILVEAACDDPEKYNIGSPTRDDGGDDLMDQDADVLDDGPNNTSERRMKSPVRAQAVKRKKNIHIEEPATKRSIIDELSEDEPNSMDADSLQAKHEDMHIIGRAMLGQNLHDIYIYIYT